VPHKKLLCKLDNYGIRDATLKWIGSFLSNRMRGWNCMPHCCSHCASLSKSFCSVSQSEKCLIGLHRIQSSAKSRVCDDITAGKSLINVRKRRCPRTDPWGTPLTHFSDCETLQNDLDKLAQWEQQWGMQFHPPNVILCLSHVLKHLSNSTTS
jgi:hypothetical protein